MAKKIKFPLIFENNLKARTLEELQQYADIENLVRYYHNGKLLTWLKDRDYDHIISDILSINNADTSYVNTLCDILGILNKNISVEVQSIQLNEIKLNRLRHLTSDMNILSNVEFIVFNQQELDELVKKNPKVIYLSSNENQNYKIDINIANTEYIGIFGNPVIQVDGRDYKSLYKSGIKFEKVILPKNLQKKLRDEVVYKGGNLGIDVDKTVAQKLNNVIQINFIDYIYDPEYRVSGLKEIVKSIIFKNHIDISSRVSK